MDTIITTIIVSVIASSGFWAFLQAIINRESVEKKALLALLHDRLYDECNRQIASGSISTDEYENLQYLMKPYKALGGNGTVERLMNEVDKLPIRKDASK